MVQCLPFSKQCLGNRSLYLLFNSCLHLSQCVEFCFSIMVLDPPSIKMVEPIHVIVGIIGLVVAAIVLPPVMSALWSVPDQIVQSSNNANLQNTYQTSKGLINAADDAKDNLDWSKAILALALLIGVPTAVIKGIFG